MAKYLDPKVDFLFKKIFGEHKDLLISFLNSLLPLKKRTGNINDRIFNAGTGT